MDQLLTPSEVAERLRRPLATVRYWRATGVGPPGARLNGRVLYRESELEAWIAQHFESGGDDDPDSLRGGDLK